MKFALARRIADAVLYEGYLLYPYRLSSAKNQFRWQFGIVAPPGVAGGEPAAKCRPSACSNPVNHRGWKLPSGFLQVQGDRGVERTESSWKRRYSRTLSCRSKRLRYAESSGCRRSSSIR